MANQNQHIFHDINEGFQDLVKTVLETQTFGVGRKPIQLNYVTTSGKQKADRFDLSVPYAQHMLQWTVMFDSNCPEMGPDFEFHDDAFLADPDVDTVAKHIPSLANWRSLQRDSLLNVLRELTLLYKQHQIEMLSQREQRLHVEYTMLIDKADVCAKDIEIIVLPDAENPEEARFVIQLDMDFSRLPGRSKTTVNDAAMVVVTFEQPNWNRMTPQLYLSTNLEQTFSNAGLPSLYLPALSREKTVMDYIPEVKKVISDRINTIVENNEKRSNFIATLLFLQRRNIVEYDAVDFSHITILLEHEDFFFLVNFTLPPTFPSKPPVVHLKSIYHVTNREELSLMQVQDFPYEPRWETFRMITAILSKIISKDVPKFREHTVNSFNLQG